MIVRLPENLEKWIREEVAGGRFPSVDDAIAEAVRRLLRDHGEIRRDREPPRPPIP